MIDRSLSKRSMRPVLHVKRPRLTPNLYTRFDDRSVFWRGTGPKKGFRCPEAFFRAVLVTNRCTLYPRAALLSKTSKTAYNVDSISNPQASSSASGIYLEFLLRRAHSRRRVDRMYWSGGSLNSFTICSKEVTVGTTGPMGSGLPQFGFPRRFAICCLSLYEGYFCLLVLGLEAWGVRNVQRS